MAQELRVRNIQEPQGYVTSRPVPIDHLNITATSSGAAQTLYTVRDTVMLRVKGMSCNNTTASSATLTLHAIPSGGSIGVSNAELTAVSIPAYTAADLTPYIGGLYKAGTTIKVYSGTNGALTIHGNGEEIL